jgi:predicted amidohydrolase YtcJ
MSHTRLILAAVLAALIALIALPTDALACGGYGPVVNTDLLTDEEDAAFTAAIQLRNEAWTAHSAAYEATEAARAAVEKLTARGVTGAALQSAQETLARAEATQQAVAESAYAAEERQRTLEMSLALATQQRQATQAKN